MPHATTHMAEVTYFHDVEHNIEEERGARQTRKGGRGERSIPMIYHHLSPFAFSDVIEGLLEVEEGQS